MANAYADLSGFPPVFRVKMLQGSEATPGRAIVDCASDSSFGIDTVPRLTTLTMATQAFSGTWPNMRVVKTLRARNGYIRVVLEDSRWILRDTRLAGNYNQRDCLGNVLTGRKKTLQELCDIIAAATTNRVQFDYGELPTFEPPARWDGKTCEEALKDLLFYTGCRCVFNPTVGTYRISTAGTGAIPQSSFVINGQQVQIDPLTLEIFRPAPKCTVSKIKFFASPTLTERKIDCTAVNIDSATGDADFIFIGTTLPTSPTEEYGQTRFRLWEPDINTNRRYFSHRVKDHMFDPLRSTKERGRVIPDDWEPFPYHQDLFVPDNEIVDMIEKTGGGVVFVTKHPVLSADDYDIAVTAKVVTSFYEENTVDDDIDFQRISTERPVDNGAQGQGYGKITIDWIKPIDSDQADVGTQVWPALLEDVADAIVKRFTPQGRPAGTVSMPEFANLGGSGQVGAVEYELRLNTILQRQNMRVALNFTPGSNGEIR